MKKTMVLVLVVLLQYPVVAQTIPYAETHTETPQVLLFNDGIYNMNNRTQTGSSYYGRIPAWCAFGINFLLGFGIGSYIQGDIVGGTVGLAGDVAGYSLMMVLVAASDRHQCGTLGFL